MAVVGWAAEEAANNSERERLLGAAVLVLDDAAAWRCDCWAPLSFRFKSSKRRLVGVACGGDDGVC